MIDYFVSAQDGVKVQALEAGNKLTNIPSKKQKRTVYKATIMGNSMEYLSGKIKLIKIASK